MGPQNKSRSFQSVACRWGWHLLYCLFSVHCLSWPCSREGKEGLLISGPWGPISRKIKPRWYFHEAPPHRCHKDFPREGNK